MHEFIITKIIQENKQLLLIDLSARLPYGVIIEGLEHPEIMTIKHLAIISVMSTEPYKPYLRSMSSMTEEEHTDFFNYHYNIALEEIKKSGDYLKAAYLSDSAKFDLLNKHHFDYRYLIEKGLAIEVTNENNPYAD